MDLSPIGEAVLVAREGRRLSAYRDSVGVWTIGIGHTSAAGPPRVVPGLTITAAACDAIFARDVEAYVAAVRDGLTVAVGQHAFDALVSVCFNIGPAAFARATFLKRLNAGDLPGARAALLWWDKPAAIRGRRAAEAEQLVTPYAKGLPRPVAGAGPVAVAAPLAAVLDPTVATPALRPVAARAGLIAGLAARLGALRAGPAPYT
ncbi:lysozyme [Methylobacterium radiodurans]|uniref:Lysozyme n=1 Tax=Methylobacterium radiodurans TaxID=2202828 RepID=A0A2U8VN99_9HYPH|nr:lysozyme [Methylobacterium radiodurans]AWN35030.1 glycoside hydrolase [Methylobacterium radiodurans]